MPGSCSLSCLFQRLSNCTLLGKVQLPVIILGIVNLINTALSNQMSRKRENSILRSIGLTRKQLCRMNICEGLCYAALAALAALLAGLPMAVVVCRQAAEAVFDGTDAGGGVALPRSIS